MSDPDLHARLAALENHLAEAETKLSHRAAAAAAAQHAETNAELRRRHAALVRQVRHEDATEESHGHHVSDLEQSVRQWFDILVRNGI